MDKIYNFTQVQPTPQQVAAGVVQPENHSMIQKMLTFSDLPDRLFLQQRAEMLAMLADDMGANAVMIGGAPFFMAELRDAMRCLGIKVFCAFSIRRLINVRKKAIKKKEAEAKAAGDLRKLSKKAKQRPVTLADASSVGHCRAATIAWCHARDVPINGATIGDILPYMDDARVTRVIHKVLSRHAT